MTNSRKTQLEVGVDTRPLKRGAEEVRLTTRRLAQGIAKDGEEAARGFDGIGAGAQGAADDVDKAAERMAASIRRNAALLESGGQRNADYFERIAQQRGKDTAPAVQKALQDLRAMEAAQRQVSAGFNVMEMSARQTTAALRQVPAQFTDIVTSLQAGQAPLTVLLQQGGQLKDVFGGVGNAARALGSYIVGLITPWTLLAAGVAAAAVGFVKGSEEAGNFSRALIQSGNAAGSTVGQLSQVAAAVASLSGGSQARAAEVLARIVEMGEVGANNLQRFTAAAIAMERAGGQAAEKTAEAFTELARKPLDASLKLNETQRYLTQSTYEQIKALEQQGRFTDAARVAQEAYAASLEQRTPAMVSSLGYVERAWLGIKDAAKAAADALLSLGRDGGTSRRIAELESQIQAYEQAGNGGFFGGAARRKADELRAERDALREVEKLSRSSATAQAERNRVLEASIKFDKLASENKGKDQKFKEEAEAIRNLGLAAGKSEEQINALIKALRQKTYGDKPKNDEEQKLRQINSLLEELTGHTSQYSQQVLLLNEAKTRGLIDQERYTQLAQELVNRQPFMRDQAEALRRELEREAKATEDAAEARLKYVLGLEKQNENGTKTLEDLRDEIDALTRGKGVLLDRITLRLEEQAAALEMQAIRAIDRNDDQAEAEALRLRAQQLRAEARLRRELATAVSDSEITAANKKAADEAAREWQRVADEVGAGLADALIRGGDDAKRYIENLFKSMVLRPFIQAVVQPLGGIALQAIGLATGSQQQGQGAGSGYAAQVLKIASSSYSGSGYAASALAAGNYGAVYSGAAYGTGFGTQQSAMLAAQEAGMVSQAGGSALGTIGAYAGYAYLAYLAAQYGEKLYGQGFSSDQIKDKDYYKYSTERVNKKVFDTIGISEKWAEILSGSVRLNHMFGRAAPRITSSGFAGTITGGDFAGNAFADILEKGGLFRSNKRYTRTEALPGEVDRYFDAAAADILQSVKTYADALGLPAERLRTVSAEVRVSVGKDAEENKKSVEEALKKYQDALYGAYADELGKFARYGETLADTATRLLAFQKFSQDLNLLGGAFSNVAGLSISAREEMIRLAGGIDTFFQQAQGFAQTYYTRDEIAGIKATGLVSELAALGLSTNVSSKDAFRALVEGTDVSTTQGREQLARLLGISGEFAQVADYLAETGRTLADAAAQAPESGAVGTFFGEGQREQIDAINEVSAGIVDVHAVLIEIRDDIRASRGSGQPAVFEVSGP